MKINEIKNILDYAMECGRLVTITLVSGGSVSYKLQ